MSIRIIACPSSKRNSASARASSVLPTPVGPMKMKLPSGRLGSWRPARARRTAVARVGTRGAGAGPPDGLGPGRDGVFLADDPLVQPFFHAQELLDLALHQ